MGIAEHLINKLMLINLKCEVSFMVVCSGIPAKNTVIARRDVPNKRVIRLSTQKLNCFGMRKNDAL